MVLSLQGRSMQTPTINENCTGCGRCVAACRCRALSLETEQPNGIGRKRAVIASQHCTACQDCLSACPHQALNLNDNLAE
jgi:ferredoxin